MIVNISLLFLLAFMVESFIEYFIGTPISQSPKLEPYKWVLIYVSAVVGVIVNIFYKIDLISFLGQLSGTTIPVSWIGIVLTGLAIGRGANFVHDIIDKFSPPPTPAP